MEEGLLEHILLRDTNDRESLRHLRNHGSVARQVKRLVLEGLE